MLAYMHAALLKGFAGREVEVAWGWCVCGGRDGERMGCITGHFVHNEVSGNFAPLSLLLI
jgi:hypothetical protein